MNGRLATVVCLVAVLAAPACASSKPSTLPAAAHSYSGPLYLAPGDRSVKHPKAGAAGNVVECHTWGDGHFSAAKVYADGATADSPEKALEVARHEGNGSPLESHLRMAKKEPDRVLYVLEVDGVAKHAVVVRNGPATKGAGGPGWYVESTASCDLSEFPRWYTDSVGVQVWTDEDGQPVPIARIRSESGPAHCDWESMTFLSIGEAVFVRNPSSDLSDYFGGPYRAHVSLPTTAVDTGFRRDGNKLWLSDDEQVAYVGQPRDAEAWPRERKPIYCA